jgi:hypothetical protein
MFKNINKSSILKKIKNLDNNKYLLGIALLLINVGSRYLIFDLSKTGRQLLKLKIIRRLTIFSIFYLGTQDTLTSFLLTGAFIIFADGLFNEKSRFYILSKENKKIIKDKIEEKQYNEAKKIIAEYENNNSYRLLK